MHGVEQRPQVPATNRHVVPVINGKGQFIARDKGQDDRPDRKVGDRKQPVACAKQQPWNLAAAFLEGLIAFAGGKGSDDGV
jgi:hypothetical protein